MLTFIIFISQQDFFCCRCTGANNCSVTGLDTGGGGEGTIVRYLQEKIGGRTPDPIPEQLQKKEQNCCGK
jgi:hypothetical protein